MLFTIKIQKQPLKQFSPSIFFPLSLSISALLIALGIRYKNLSHDKFPIKTRCESFQWTEIKNRSRDKSWISKERKFSRVHLCLFAFSISFLQRFSFNLRRWEDKLKAIKRKTSRIIFIVIKWALKKWRLRKRPEGEGEGCFVNLMNC